VGKRQLKKALIAELEAAQGGIVAAHELIATPMTRSAEHPGSLAEMAKVSYSEYLKTEHWRNTRKLAVVLYGHRCAVCNRPRALHVHHKTYENVGREPLIDLTLLCKTCHRVVHAEVPACLDGGRKGAFAPRRWIRRQVHRNQICRQYPLQVVKPNQSVEEATKRLYAYWQPEDIETLVECVESMTLELAAAEGSDMGLTDESQPHASL